MKYLALCRYLRATTETTAQYKCRLPLKQSQVAPASLAFYVQFVIETSIRAASSLLPPLGDITIECDHKSVTDVEHRSVRIPPGSL